MVISSRTPEGWPNHCPICEQEVCVDPSLGTRDAPCPNCGVLLWFLADSKPVPDGSVLATVYDDLMSAAYSKPTLMPKEFTIPAGIIELVPESVARENLVIPLDEKQNQLVVAFADPLEFECYDKLRFVLNRPIGVVHTHADWIEQKIEEHYGSPPPFTADNLN